MAIVKLSHSEQRWIAREVEVGQAGIARAQAEAQRAQRAALADICTAHGESLPPGGLAVSDAKGQVLALVWGEEQAAWLNGTLKIEGAVSPVPPVPPLRFVPSAKATEGAPSPALDSGKLFQPTNGGSS